MAKCSGHHDEMAQKCLFIFMYFYTCTQLHTCTQAGVVKEMDSFANRFMSASDERETILSEAETMAGTHDDPQ